MNVRVGYRRGKFCVSSNFVSSILMILLDKCLKHLGSPSGTSSWPLRMQYSLNFHPFFCLSLLP